MQVIKSDTHNLMGEDPPRLIDLCPPGMGPLTRCPLFFHTEGGNPAWKPAFSLSDRSMSVSSSHPLIC